MLIKILFLASPLWLATAETAEAKVPALYVWYHNYGKNLAWCRDLSREVLENTDRNWNFVDTKYGETRNWFRLTNTRGHVGCSNRGGNKSLVTIVVTGNDGSEASQIFEEIKLGVCGTCSKLAN